MIYDAYGDIYCLVSYGFQKTRKGKKRITLHLSRDDVQISLMERLNSFTIRREVKFQFIIFFKACTNALRHCA